MSFAKKKKPTGMRGGKPVKKAKSLSKWKHELDAVFSKYIRKTHPAICYTCGGIGKVLQCGHFIARSYLATRFDESNCRPQCVGCNMFGRGKPLEFEEHLKAELGDEFVEEMKTRRHNITKITPAEYEVRIEYYKRLIK